MMGRQSGDQAADTHEEAKAKVESNWQAWLSAAELSEVWAVLLYAWVSG